MTEARGAAYPDDEVYRSPGAARQYFTGILPSLERRAMTAFSYLDPDAREEAVAETVAICWKDYVGCLGKGKRVTPGNLAYYAVKHVREGNLFNGKQTRDVMGDRARILGRAHVESIYRADSVDGWCDDGSWHEHAEALIDRRTWERPPEVARIRIDYGDFLNRDGLTYQQRRTFELLADGYRPSEIADELGVARAQVSQLKRTLGKKLRSFYGERLVAAGEDSD